MSSITLQPLVIGPGRWAVTLSPFDQVALSVLLWVAFLILFMVWRGDQIGVQVVAVSPAEGAKDVSTRAILEVTFDQKIAAIGSGFPLSVIPAVDGTLRWAESTVAFVPTQALAPDTTYTVTLTTDLQSQQGRPLHGPLTWQFHTRQPRVLYVAADAQGIDQLFVINPAGGIPTQLTYEKFGVWDFVLSPDGSTII